MATCLITGIFTGWFRLGFDLPVESVFLHHGAIMTGSFLGTVILLERIVAMKKKWLFAFPLINGSSVIFYFLNLKEIAFSCLIIGAFGLVFVFFLINLKHGDLPHRIMWIGATAWLIGNIHLFLFASYAHSILWWMAFLLLTIVGERLELSRFLPVSDAKKYALVGFLIIFLLSGVLPFHLGGQYLTGASMVLISGWLVLYDMVRKSMKMPGVHRFSAITLLCGYVWLAIARLLYILNVTGEVTYDALIHSFFLGFIFSMIFAHAPIILPGVLGLNPRPYHPSLYLWVALFQVSLVVRVSGGLFSINGWKQWGGLVNGIVILLFLINLVGLVGMIRTSVKKQKSL
ncbi:MAG: hypothetical protein KI791_21695 [Cyclobacteriaceae bacterium]|nr:hypothetical protein [Cyclobacteriaceae bacterium SS2]